jgi:hypothetical protein
MRDLAISLICTTETMATGHYDGNNDLYAASASEAVHETRQAITYWTKKKPLVG